ncbi:hypothetical protein CTI12_AA253520 [Artemisia annua]|uniref:RWP-RK domain-containing protein n=1 Tax=Artemisia annua TaxID=35608 RepID=A0A2U1NKM6_ARTAN|nr:hypothetical protein CTI12_AA253520 [Artemisia annua]
MNMNHVRVTKLTSTAEVGVNILNDFESVKPKRKRLIKASALCIPSIISEDETKKSNAIVDLETGIGPFGSLKIIGFVYLTFICTTTVWRELSREMITRHFYMAVDQAAKKLGVGLSSLKRQCRDMGIKHCPCRKLNSLQELIKHFQDENAGEKSDPNMLEIIRRLEVLKRQVEDSTSDSSKDEMKFYQQKKGSSSNKVEASKSLTSKQSAKLAFADRIKVLGLPNKKNCDAISIKPFAVKNPKEDKIFGVH